MAASPARDERRAPAGWALGVIVVVDNRDSYTYNLVQLLLELSDQEVRVVDAGDMQAVDACLGWVSEGLVAGVVISPGPGHPAEPADFAGSAVVLDAALAEERLPVLGVCLGHEGIAVRYGGEVVPAPEAKHGWRSPLSHDGSGPFAGVPQGSLVTRYHSLVVSEPLPSGLRVTARSEDGVVQGLEVEGRPVWGVQFHPESIASEHGRQMVANFVDAVDAAGLGAPPRGARGARRARGQRDASRRPAEIGAFPRPAARELFVASRVVRGPQPEGTAAAEAAAAVIYREVLRRGSASVWVDVPDDTGRQARFSILADDAPIGIGTCPAHAARLDGSDEAAHETEPGCETCEPARVLRLDGDGSFETVQRELEAMRAVGGDGLAFRGGLLGYFGYELGVRMLGVLPREAEETASPLPDAWWLDPRRAVLVDRATGAVTVVATASSGALAEAGAERFSSEVGEALEASGGERQHALPDVGRARAMLQGPDVLADGAWHTSREQYAADIDRCRDHLLAGDSYELCLTNAFRPHDDPDPLSLFLEVRAADPAPYAALLEFDGGAVVSASPERLLRGTPDGEYETKPIKGTAARASDPLADAAAARDLANDPKVFAENLMIVDLLRNDLGRVCTPGSVHVPSLMAVESYTTVHQLVTTVRGSAPGVPPLDVVRALFPGGSMTGAPKLRSVELLRDIEGRDRGVYAGALGVLGADGSTELSIVIRTAVRDARGWSIGAGGAIVLASDPESETVEVELKASALRRAFTRAVSR
ncbi:aminodeoxychorismate synthase component I [Pseudoclavibacter sp. RFBI5]|uniref:chorismate-binding protein n=1 Tax=Pseudoclavibacter sp. RFBI5 TaxID=2080578 RepID=UPI000CE7BE59|nr:chorismate-binding protein [Pseudoclavibacter sp. RFBI5]PPG04869.1 aminodeoxychorismate synthase component I [Pseudoclavibacter sp. RFBI5]